MTDPSLFKISYLVGDISTGNLPPSHPLPVLTPAEHAQLRTHLHQECDWHREWSGIPGGKKDRLFTDRIAESLRLEKELLSGAKGDGKRQAGVNVVKEKADGKALKEFEKMVKAISNAALMEFRVGLSLVVRDISLQARRDLEAFFEEKMVGKEDDEVSVATLVDAGAPLGAVEVEKGSESSGTLGAFEKVDGSVKKGEKEWSSFGERWLQVLAFAVCLVQLFGFGFKAIGWVLERVLEPKGAGVEHDVGFWF